MSTQHKTIRDLRESKNLSEDRVAEACGLTYSRFVRIQAGEGKTTQEEIDAVLKVLEKMEPGTRKLAGRPFKDAAKQAAVAAARETGTSVAAAIAGATPQAPSPARSSKSALVATPAPAEEETPKPKRSRSKAAGTTPTRTRKPKG